MEGHSNGKSDAGQTQFCRTPKWLYASGVSLQAIATYGWLHGQYGHFAEIKPSYARLAKELGVARPSAIAYMKELIGARAIRIKDGFGGGGRQSNVYEIAYDAPFPPEPPKSSGQHSDWSAFRPVGGLTSSGQHSDPSGQPVGHEEEVFKKKNSKTLSSGVREGDRPSASAHRREITKTQSEEAVRQLLERHTDLAPPDVPAFLAWAKHKYPGRSKAWWQTVAENGDLPDRVDQWRQAVARGWRPWCGECDRQTRRVPIPDQHQWRSDGRDSYECPRCHPEDQGWQPPEDEEWMYR